MGWAATPILKSYRVLFGAWVLLSACLIVALTTVAIERAAANDFRIANVDLVELASSTGTGGSGDSVAEDAHGGVAPDALARRSGPPLDYAGTAWTVISSRIIPRTEQYTSRPIVVTDVVVQNSTSNATIRVRAGDVTMIWPSGRRDPLARFEFIEGSKAFTLSPGESLAVTLVFKPKATVDPVLQELTLEIGEHGRIPARMPMTGPAPGSVFPIPGSVDGGTSVMADPDSPGHQLVIDPLSASIGIDAGPYRSALHRRLAIIEMQVQRVATTAESSFLQPGFWQLHDGRQVLSPVRVVAPGPGEGPDPDLVTLVFVVDAESDDSWSELMLIAGADTFRALSYPVELSDSTTTERNADN